MRNQRVADLDGRTEAGFAEMREGFRALRGELAEDRRASRQMAAGI